MANQTQRLARRSAEREWAAFLAIDWADKKHCVRLLPADSTQTECGNLEGTPEAVDVWAMELSQRFGGRPIAVCLEQKRGALVVQLAKFPHFVLFPVHPNTSAQYRQTFSPSGAKDDEGDTESLLDLLLKHRDQLQALLPDTEQTRVLQILVELRRKLVNEKTRQKNRLTNCLKMYFPQVLAWFDSIDSAVVLDLLERWGHLEELQKAHPGTLKKFFVDHNCRGQERLQERIKLIGEATPPTRDPAIVEGQTACARAFAALIAILQQRIDILDQRIEQLVADHPDGTLFASFPSAAKVYLPRLIVAFGTQRDRFDTAYDMHCLSGIAPITRSSSGSKLVAFRRACPQFLRQTFHEFAAHSIHSPNTAWPQAYYQAQRDKGRSHHAAVRSLAYKWIRILFRCWKDGRPYDDQTYVDSLQRHNSPIAALGGEWKEVDGFKKFCISKKTPKNAS